MVAVIIIDVNDDDTLIIMILIMMMTMKKMMMVMVLIMLSIPYRNNTFKVTIKASPAPMLVTKRLVSKYSFSSAYTFPETFIDTSDGERSPPGGKNTVRFIMRWVDSKSGSQVCRKGQLSGAKLGQRKSLSLSLIFCFTWKLITKRLSKYSKC